MQDYKKLKVWKLSHNLVINLYKITSSFPANERFSLVSQIKRAAISIPANIAEGCGRGSNNDLARFIKISLGSAFELEYFIFLSVELKFITSENSENILSKIIEIKQMLSSLLKKIKTT